MCFNWLLRCKDRATLRRGNTKVNETEKIRIKAEKKRLKRKSEKNYIHI